MKEEQGTRERLLKSAQKEFGEKGYMKASLRNICAQAGVTTGALYFFFQDKEDLFGALVEEPIKGIYDILYRHFDEESEMLSQPSSYVHADGDHDLFAEALVRHLYSNYDAFLLLLKKSQGSHYENFVDDVTMFLEKRYLAFMTHYAEEQNLSAPNAFFVHLIIHISVDLQVQLLLHESDVDKAVAIQKKLLDFIVGGCMKLVFSK